MSTANKAAKCASTQDAFNPAGTCPFGGLEIGIIPVRYAFDILDAEGKSLHPLPDNDTKWKGRFAAKQRQYTLRQLRDGWLYVYDETDKTFHEYKVNGYTFTKIDWSSTEAGKPAAERGTEGETKSCLVYPAGNILYITFAHQRWTWRLCEHMRSHAPNRSIWMRKVNLKQFQSTLSHPHAGLSCELGMYVADIDSDGVPINGDFEITCTPFMSAAVQSDDFKHVSEKKACSDLDYRADLPAQDCGMFVALDDPLADVSDLFLPLAEEVALRSATLKDEDHIHKLQMAEITRTLSRVKLERDELPEHIKDDPIKILEFERQLTDYLAVQYRADKERVALESNSKLGVAPFTDLQEEALARLSELKQIYLYTPTKDLQENWQQAAVFSDEVKWDELDAFLIEHYTQLKDQDKKIEALYQDFMGAFVGLGTDPLVIGLDNQDEDHLAYLLSLISQYLMVAKQAVNTEEAYAQLDHALSLDSPRSMFALASLGFSIDNWQALNSWVKELEVSLLSVSNPSDMVALSGSIANWGGFTGDVRLHDRPWFKALTEPVQKSFSALQSAVSGSAYGSWRALSDLLFPSQMSKTANPQGLAKNLRLVFLETLVNPKAIVAHNPHYPEQLTAWERKLNTELATIRRISNTPKGHVTPKNHQIQTMQRAQRRLQRLLSSELPMMVMLKHEAFNSTAKQMLEDAVSRTWMKGKQVAEASWDKLGRMGGLAAILSIWNAAVVLQNIRQKADLYPEHDLWTNPAIREAVYATGYAVSQVTALWRDAAWSKMVTDEKLLKKSLSEAIKKASFSEGAILKTFVRTTVAVSLFGLIATGFETWESIDKYSDSSHSQMERFGYGLKGLSTISQTAVFAVQFVRSVISRLGLLSISIGTIIAPWMTITLMVSSFVLLIAFVVINAFKRSDLEKWLLHSTWGKNSKKWGFIEELTSLEKIIHKPQMQLKSIPTQRPRQWMDPGTNQWQLELSLPPYTIGNKIGLQITRKPKEINFHSGYVEKAETVLLNEQYGNWSENEKGEPIFRLNLGGSTQDTITVFVNMPFNWGSASNELLGYTASGNSEGYLSIFSVHESFATRIVKVSTK